MTESEDRVKKDMCYMRIEYETQKACKGDKGGNEAPRSRHDDVRRDRIARLSGGYIL